jgi:hypothetical protein
MGCRGPQAPSTRTRLGVPARGRSAWWPRRSGCRPRLRHPVRVLGQCPVSGASDQCPRLPVHGTAVECPVRASERPGVRCPASGVGVRCCALPRPLCPAEVRSWSAAWAAAVWLGWPGWRDRPLRPCPARGLPESAPRARSWRRRCWASRGVGMNLAVVVGGGWAVASSTAWPTRIGRVHARIIRWWEPVRSEARLLRQADRHAAANRSAGLAGRAQHQEANRTHPVSKAVLMWSGVSMGRFAW